MSEKLRLYSLVVAIFLVNQIMYGQQKTEYAGWLFLSHEHKLSEKWSLSADIQLRSADEFSYLQNLLIRPGINYNLIKKQTVSLGYCFYGTWDVSK